MRNILKGRQVLWSNVMNGLVLIHNEIEQHNVYKNKTIHFHDVQTMQIVVKNVQVYECVLMVMVNVLLKQVDELDCDASQMMCDLLFVLRICLQPSVILSLDVNIFNDLVKLNQLLIVQQ